MQIKKFNIGEFKNRFPYVFSNEKSLKIVGFKAYFCVKPEAVPVFAKPYTLQYSLRDAVELELEELVRNGIIVLTHVSEWGSPVVVVPKKNTKSIRMCVDFKATLNPYLKQDHYPLPRIDEIFDKIGHGKVFTVLDLSNAYLQLEVDERCQKYFTINTHKGLFYFTRLPFGISCAPAQFQATMDEVLKGIPQTACYIDDVIITGNNLEDCYVNVNKVFNKLNDHRIRINDNKCKFFVETVEILGHEVSQQGIKPLKSKCDAILKVPSPQNLQQLRSYLGLLNYYSRFLPMASTILKPLYNLEQKNIRFEWSKKQEAAFQASKKLIKNSSLLVPFDPEKDIIIATDASPYGIGAVLSHQIDNVERPVMFISRTLTPTEEKYAQLHREVLAVVFAIKKLHKYIYGQHFKLITDHKPLLSIFSPEKKIPVLTASRLQNWSHLLASYQYTIEYKKGSKMGNVDALSRLPNESKEEEVDDVNFAEFHELPVTTKEVQECTMQDTVLQNVSDYCRNGWPDKVQQEVLLTYFKGREEFSLENGIILLGNRIVIPYQLRKEVLEILHDKHIGIVCMKMLARNEVW